MNEEDKIQEQSLRIKATAHCYRIKKIESLLDKIDITSGLIRDRASFSRVKLPRDNEIRKDQYLLSYCLESISDDISESKKLSRDLLIHLMALEDLVTEIIKNDE